MPNAADALLAGLTKTRGYNGKLSNLTPDRRKAEVVTLVAEVERVLLGLDTTGVNVTIYLDSVDTWYAMALGTAESGTTEVAKNMLIGLSTLLDALAVTGRYDHSDLEELLTVLNDAEQLVTTAALPREDRIYLLGLIGEARQAVRRATVFGTVGPRRLTIELGGAMMSTALDTEDPPTRRGLIELGGRALRFFGVKVAEKAITTGLDEVVKQIAS